VPEFANGRPVPRRSRATRTLKASFTNCVHAANQTKLYRLHNAASAIWQEKCVDDETDVVDQLRESSLAGRFSLPRIGSVAMRGEARTTAVKRHAVAILLAFEEADAQLVGKAVILTDGTAGTVEARHGIRVNG
jgi:hypothetical protein